MIHSWRVHSLKYLLNHSGNSFILPQVEMVPFEPLGSIWKGPVPEIYNLEFSQMAFTWAGRYRAMQVNSSSIDELKNTGMFSNIQDPGMKKDIDNYYSYMKWAFFDELHDESVSKWNYSLLDAGIFYYQIEDFPNPLDLIVKSPQRIAYLKNIIAEANYRSKLAANTSQTIDSLIPKIEAEIKD